MFLSADTLQLLMSKGICGDDLVEVYRALEADFRSTQPAPTEPSAADRKRARDAARMAEKRERERLSRDVAATVAEQPPLPRPLSPQTPLTPTPTPPDISTRVKGPQFAKPNGFARFWEAYPNKVGKAAAEKAFATACKRIGGHDPPGVLLEGLERAKASRQWSEGYIPHPTTWLNRGQWEDEPAPQPNPRQAHERNHQDRQPTTREEGLRAMHAGAMAALDRRTAGVG